METLVLLVPFVLGYLVSWIQWYQPENRKVRVQKAIALLQKNQIEKLESDLRLSRSKVQAQQLDLDRVAEKNRKWAKETVDRVMSESGQEWPRAKGWKMYQESKTVQEQESELNQESDRQQAERNRWLQE